jgi:hypothetical protein
MRSQYGRYTADRPPGEQLETGGVERVDRAETTILGSECADPLGHIMNVANERQ